MKFILIKLHQHLEDKVYGSHNSKIYLEYKTYMELIEGITYYTKQLIKY